MNKEIIFGNMKSDAEIRDKWIKEKLSLINRDESILDCGAGEQKYKKFCRHLKYKSQDFCQFDGAVSAGLDRDRVWIQQRLILYQILLIYLLNQILMIIFYVQKSLNILKSLI